MKLVAIKFRWSFRFVMEDDWLPTRSRVARTILEFSILLSPNANISTLAWNVVCKFVFKYQLQLATESCNN